jgi:hypothetical protein
MLLKYFNQYLVYMETSLLLQMLQKSCNHMIEQWLAKNATLHSLANITQKRVLIFWREALVTWLSMQTVLYCSVV